jgi:predicted naringenin-chalcone synthase
MNAPTIYAIGTAVPLNKIPQEHHYSILESANGLTRLEKLTLRKIYSRSGISYRHSVLNEFALADDPANILFHPSGKYENTTVADRMKLFEQYAPGLCKKAAEECFATLPTVNKKDITHIVTFSCTGMSAPGLDIHLIEQLGLQRNIERTCINFMGCYAAINALKSAYHIARSQPDAVVLIAGAELCSLHYRRSNDTNQLVANALFSDGAAAAIISAKHIEKHNNELNLSLKDFYAEFEQSASEEMVWRIGNNGFDLRLTPEVPIVVKDNIKALADKLFLKTGLKKEDIHHYALHPGGMKILEACEEALNITKEQNEISYSVLNDYGNMSSTTILFVLKRYLAKLTTNDINQNILACAFGPGISMESMIVQTC